MWISYDHFETACLKLTPVHSFRTQNVLIYLVSVTVTSVSLVPQLNVSQRRTNSNSHHCQRLEHATIKQLMVIHWVSMKKSYSVREVLNTEKKYNRPMCTNKNRTRPMFTEHIHNRPMYTEQKHNRPMYTEQKHNI